MAGYLWRMDNKPQREVKNFPYPRKWQQGRAYNVCREAEAPVCNSMCTGNEGVEIPAYTFT